VKIEVEVQTEEGANDAIEAGADIVMLDNFDGPGLRQAAGSIRSRWNLGATSKGVSSKVLLECSGGLTEENVASYLCNGLPLHRISDIIDVDIYSTSAVHRTSFKLRRANG
jgi:nicotinate-nucleotide pyrophosphorylase (carboxylating)